MLVAVGIFCDMTGLDQRKLEMLEIICNLSKTYFMKKADLRACGSLKEQNMEEFSKILASRKILKYFKKVWGKSSSCRKSNSVFKAHLYRFIKYRGEKYVLELQKVVSTKNVENKLNGYMFSRWKKIQVLIWALMTSKNEISSFVFLIFAVFEEVFDRQRSFFHFPSLL